MVCFGVKNNAAKNIRKAIYTMIVNYRYMYMYIADLHSLGKKHAFLKIDALASCFMKFTMLRKIKIWKVVRSCNTSSYHTSIWDSILLCVDTDCFSVALYFTRERRLYLSQKNQRYIIQ